MNKAQKILLGLSPIAHVLITISVIIMSEKPNVAQIIPDHSLGDENSVIQSHEPVNGMPTEIIEGGANRGVNLFHSFSEFNVGQGQAVYFSNPAQVLNILTRVTGNNASNIFGKLGVLGNANLFLLNPHGIIFGVNAQLDITGSFLASTADSFIFADGNVFSATNPQAPPLLTVNLRPGLQYGTATPQPVINAGNLSIGGDLILSAGSITSTGKLTATNGQIKVEAVAGDVQIQNLQGQSATLTAQGNLILEESQLYTQGDLHLLAEDTVKIRDSQNQPFLAVAGGNLLIQGGQFIDIFALEHPQSGLVSGGDMILHSGNAVKGDAHYFSYGNFQIQENDSQTGDLYSDQDPIILAIGDVEIGNYTGASLHILAGGNVTLADVKINQTGDQDTTINPRNDSLIPGTNTRYSDLSQINLSDGRHNLTIQGDRQATLDVRAGIDWSQFPFTGLPELPNSRLVIPPGSVPLINSNDNPSGANINVNNITILAANGQVYLSNQYYPRSNSGSGIEVSSITTSNFLNGGLVSIDSQGEITVNNTITTSGTFGQGGNITLFAQKDINVNNAITASSFLGQGGNVTLVAQGDININRSIKSESFRQAGGNINFLSQNGDVTIKGSISTQTASTQVTQTNGSINIKAQNINFIYDPNVDITSDLSTTTLGSTNSGDIILKAEENILIDQRRLLTRTFGQGNGGKIDITTDTLTIKSSLTRQGRIVADTQPQATGNAGEIIIRTNQIQLLGKDVGIFSETQGEGNAGIIRIESNGNPQLTINLSDQAQISTKTISSGQGGTIEVNAPQQININGQGSLLTTTNNLGNAGNITFNSNVLKLTDRVNISASTTRQGKGGTINVVAPQAILLQNSTISTETNGLGVAGQITFTTDTLTLENGSRVSATTESENVNATGGTITVNANQINLFGNDTGFFAETRGVAPAGFINLQPNSNDHLTVNFADNAQISVSTFSVGAGGNINLNAPESITLTGEGIISTATEGAGVAGNITITTEILTIDDGVKISALTNSNRATTARGGTITIDANQINFLGNDNQVSTETRGIAQAGDIVINTEQLTVRGVSISGKSGNNANGNAGTLKINASQSIYLLAQGELTVEALGNASAGNLIINTPSLILEQGAKINASTVLGVGGDIILNGLNTLQVKDSSITASTVDGRAGNLEVNARERVDLNHGRLAVEATGNGSSGRINLNTPQLTLDHNSQISATTNSGTGGNINLPNLQTLNLNDSSITASTVDGRAGNLEVNARERVDLNHGRLAVEATGNGSSGRINLNTPQLTLENNSQISARTNSGTGGDINLPNLQTLNVQDSNITASTIDGRAGNLEINARERVDLNHGSFAVEATGNGSSGRINLNTPQLTLDHNSQISATTNSGIGGDINLSGLNNLNMNNSRVTASTRTGEAGNLRVEARNSVQISGNGGLFVGATEGGTAGNLFLDPILVLLRDGAKINVSSPQGQAGNIEIIANTLWIDGGSITAETGLSEGEEGANIKLNVSDFIILDNNSLISATAFERANGGNIDINTRFLFALLSREGKGNDIQANAEFGNGGRVSITATGIFGIEFRTQPTSLNDITVSSQFGTAGVVEINQKINPTENLDETVEISNQPQLLQGCQVSDYNTASSFISKGRGGLSLTPAEISNNNTWEDLDGANRHNYSVSVTPIIEEESPQQIIEAQGWIIGENEVIILTEKTATVTPKTPLLSSLGCGEFNLNH